MQRQRTTQDSAIRGRRAGAIRLQEQHVRGLRVDHAKRTRALEGELARGRIKQRSEHSDKPRITRDAQRRDKRHAHLFRHRERTLKDAGDVRDEALGRIAKVRADACQGLGVEGREGLTRTFIIVVSRNLRGEVAQRGSGERLLGLQLAHIAA